MALHAHMASCEWTGRVIVMMFPTIKRESVEAIPPALSAAFSPLLARLYAKRGVATPDQLGYELKHLPDWRGLMGAEAAANDLADAVLANQSILVVGDYDTDGATSTALAVRALLAMGGNADFLLPNRFTFGYGLSPEIVAVAAERAPDVLVTVDNGIASLDGVAAAKAAGMRVIITDHHLPGEQLPDADAIVNPNQPGDGFGSKAMAGVGVVFYLMLGLRHTLRARGWFTPQRPEPNLAELLDLVALGTVADVVPLDDLNRTLVEQGLRRIRAGRACAGIQALIEVSGRDATRMRSSDLGFAIAPRLNAAGRLEDMTLGVACLLTDDLAQARRIAAQLHELNHERRAIEQEMRLDADALLEQMLSDHGEHGLPWGLCLFDPSWHQGVIGILASRVREAVHRPVIVFAEAGNGVELKGSARSIPGLHLRDVLDRVATRHPGLVTRFGGHAMAAGLTLPVVALARFSQAFDAEIRAVLSPEQLQGVIVSDGELTPDDLTLESAAQLQLAGPWGQGFPEPLFDGEFLLLARQVVGGHHLRMTLCTDACDAPLTAIAFNTTDSSWPVVVKRIRMVYQLDVNEFRGNRQLQLLVRHVEAI